MSAFRWIDAYLLGIAIEYEQVVLDLRDSAGDLARISALGHVGVSLVGFWDETVIDDAKIVADHPFGELCRSSIEERLGTPLDSGSPDRNSKHVETLVVSLSDGAQLLIAAASFVVERC